MAARAGFQSVAPSGGAGASGGAGVAAALGPGGTPGPPVRMGPAPGQGLYRSPMPGAAYPVSGAGGGARGPGAGPSEGGGLAGGREEEGEGLPWEGRGSRVAAAGRRGERCRGRACTGRRVASSPAPGGGSIGGIGIVSSSRSQCGLRGGRSGPRDGQLQCPEDTRVRAADGEASFPGGSG